jgi:hypothetical protein
MLRRSGRTYDADEVLGPMMYIVIKRGNSLLLRADQHACVQCWFFTDADELILCILLPFRSPWKNTNM